MKKKITKKSLVTKKETKKIKDIKQLNKKSGDLKRDIENNANEFLTTNQGLRINNNNNTLKAGDRGPSLLEDFIFREKITHFDHERIPERIVHARGSGAHGYFQVYKSMEEYTKAGFLCNPKRETPVFVRFSTVAGSRGSTDLARDVRGFAVKFYTEEGVFDLVGNNMPVFFIQDAIKFPDLVHAVKPEPHNEIPQAASAHDTFWDFISLMPESTHMIMWLMSDRAIPRSYRMMEGFGVHTFRFINEAGEAFFVKFHWKPLQGTYAVVWDEAQIISGKDPDFHRRDLFDNIESGNFPEWELGVQIIPEADEFKFNFDLLDPTKIIPEELIPVQRIGKMVLNKNPENFFAETEQVAFHPGHIVPGIDFTNDPLLQGRLFSYTDTQLIRLGGPNFHEIPINRSIAPVHNNQRDGYHRHQINKGQTSYEPNSINGGCPFQAKMADGGFSSYMEKIDAQKVRARSRSFLDHFSQAKLFYNSQTEPEKKHIINALRFELGKVFREEIRERMLHTLMHVDMGLAQAVAEGLGLPLPSKLPEVENHSIGADDNPAEHKPTSEKLMVEISDALSMLKNPDENKKGIETRMVAILAADGVNGMMVRNMKDALQSEGALCKVISTHLGFIKGTKNDKIFVDQTYLTGCSVFYDAIYIPGGAESVASLVAIEPVLNFIKEAYRHCKPIAADNEGIKLLQAAIESDMSNPEEMLAEGIVTNMNSPEETIDNLIKAMLQHRFFIREEKVNIMKAK